MSNSRRGADAERALRKKLEDEGYLVIRSAASKTPYDLIAIGHEEVRLIQVKRSKRMAVVKIPLHPRIVVKRIRQELWCWLDRHGWTTHELGV